MDYRRQAILTRSKNGKFESRVSACQVVGAAVESSLKLAYRPRVGSLPVPLAFQQPVDIPTVSLKDVLPPGHTRAKASHDVQVFPRDAELALKVSKECVSKFQLPPYNLEVNTVDHTGKSRCATPRDLLLSTRVGLPSCLPVGLYSVEVRCREVVDKGAFPWEKTLTEEAMPLWAAELAAQHSPFWKARILVFACFPRPCHAGGYSLNASILYPGSTRWERLWGWAGFKAAYDPEPRAKAKAANVATSSPKVVLPVPTREQKWQRLKVKLPVVGGFAQLTHFLKELKLPSSQVKRDYITGRNAWRLGEGRGRTLATRKDWDHKPGSRGGGAGRGHGPIYVELGALQQIFNKYYSQRSL